MLRFQLTLDFRHLQLSQGFVASFPFPLTEEFPHVNICKDLLPLFWNIKNISTPSVIVHYTPQIPHPTLHPHPHTHTLYLKRK